MIATVRSRCQVFAFQRPRHQELVQLLRRVCDGEEIAALDSALALIARSARGSFRDAVSTLDQLSSATGGDITVPAVLQLLGSVEEEALFRLIDLVIDRDTAGALVVIMPVVLTWASDTGAYFTGRVLGGPKLIPSVSPAKTVSGAIGAVVATVGACAAFVHFLLKPQAQLAFSPTGSSPCASA